jgi:hypothetical protein
MRSFLSNVIVDGTGVNETWKRLKRYPLRSQTARCNMHAAKGAVAHVRRLARW